MAKYYHSLWDKLPKDIQKYICDIADRLWHESLFEGSRKWPARAHYKLLDQIETYNKKWNLKKVVFWHNIDDPVARGEKYPPFFDAKIRQKNIYKYPSKSQFADPVVRGERSRIIASQIGQR